MCDLDIKVFSKIPKHDYPAFTFCGDIMLSIIECDILIPIFNYLTYRFFSVRCGFSGYTFLSFKYLTYFFNSNILNHNTVKQDVFRILLLINEQ